MKHSLTLRQLITIPFFILTLLGTLSVGFYTIFSSIQSVVFLSEKLTDTIHFEVKNKLDTYLNIPKKINSTNYSIQKNNLISMEDTIIREKYFASQLIEHPEIVMNYYGTTSGEFYGARRNINGDVEVVRNNLETGGNSCYYSLNNDLNAEKLSSVFKNFDCRTRPWYTSAIIEKGPIYSKVYKHFVFDDLVITASHPSYENDKLQGVFGADILLGSLNHFLKGVRAETMADIIITEGDEKSLVANSSGIANFYITQNGDYKRLPIKDIISKRMLNSLNAMDEKSLFSGFITQHYLANKFSYNYGVLQWDIHVLIPRSVYFNKIWRSIVFSLLFSIFICISLLFIGYFISGLIIHPVKNLIEYSEEISHNNWEYKIDIIKGDNEIAKLQYAFVDMATRIQHSLSNLEGLVEHKAAIVIQEREQLMMLFDAIPEPIFVSDILNHKVFYANKTFIKTFGALSGENKCYESVLNKSSPCEVCTPLLTLEKGKPSYRQFYNEHVNKHYYLIESYINWHENKDAIFQLAIDISKLKEAEAELIKSRENIRQNELVLKELNANKDKLFSIIAHDLRNPFNAILGISDVLKTEYNDIDKSRFLEFISHIHSSAESAYRLLENLLEWSRSQVGALKIQTEKIQVSSIINSSFELVYMQAKQKKINLNKSVDEELTIIADINMMQTVLRNLLSNAIKFTKEGGDIVIKAYKKENSAIISVIDNGVGIDESAIDKLFQMEGKVVTYGTNNETGSGLGLLLCKEFVEKNFGVITVESQKGKGSNFSINMPLV